VSACIEPRLTLAGCLFAPRDGKILLAPLSTKYVMNKNRTVRFKRLSLVAAFSVTTTIIFAAASAWHTHGHSDLSTAELPLTPKQSDSDRRGIRTAVSDGGDSAKSAGPVVSDVHSSSQSTEEALSRNSESRNLVDNGIDYPEDKSRPWLGRALAKLPDSAHWRDQIDAHLAQPRTSGWAKFEAHAIASGVNPLKLPTFAQMAESSHVASKLTVRLRDGVDAENALDDLGLGITHARAFDSRRMTGGLHTYNVYPGLAVYDVLEVANAHPAVVYAEPDYTVDLALLPRVPNENLVGPDAWWLDQVNAYEAWDIATDARSFGPILVVDSGLSRSHEDLQGNFWINPDEIAGNGIDDDNNGYVDDLNGLTAAPSSPHGTSVGGTLCARGNNTIGYTGLVWRCQLMDGNAGGSWDSVSSASSALIYATSKGSRLSNHSWGGPIYSQALKDVVTQVAANDHLLVIAAHNYAQDLDSDPIYPAAFDNDNIISVAGSNPAENKVNYSDYGVVSVDLAAPTEFQTTELGGGYAKFAGTSQSTPMVTAAVALAWAQVPDWNYTQIKQLTLDSARPIASWQGLTATGGILDMQAMMAGLGSGNDPVSMTIDDTAVNESAGTAVVKISLSRAATNPVQVTAFTRQVTGSAIGGQDFYGKTQVLNFAVGETSKSFDVVILPDAIAEAAETFHVRLYNESGAVVTDRVGVVTINDGGVAAPTLSVSDQSISESVGTVQIPVTLSRSASSAVTVTAFTRTNGTASAGQDLYGTTQRLSFAPGQTTQMMTVTIIGDTVSETPETFFVHLVNASGAAIANGIGTMTIVDSVTEASFSISSVSVNEGNGSAALTISLSSPANASVTAFTRGQSADGGGRDFYGFTRTLNFSATGSTSQTVILTLRDDTETEATESMVVRLVRSNGAGIGVAEGVVTIDDND